MTIALGAVLLVGLVSWYLIESGRRKRTLAAEALERAQATMETGNYPEASNQLQRVTQLYAGTDAAFQAVLALNQVRMLSGQSQLAADELTRFIATRPPSAHLASARMHLGLALENLGKFREAGAAHEASAAAAEPAFRKTDALLSAARAYRLAGDSQKAVEILTTLIKTLPPEAPGLSEAKVRLAEITGGRL
jgi:TolA-binding protein